MNYPTGMYAFVNGLTAADFATLQSAVYQRDTDERRKRAMELSPLNDEERTYLTSDFIRAIRLYRDRTGVTLLEAKIKIDAERDKLREDKP